MAVDFPPSSSRHHLVSTHLPLQRSLRVTNGTDHADELYARRYHISEVDHSIHGNQNSYVGHLHILVRAVLPREFLVLESLRDILCEVLLHVRHQQRAAEEDHREGDCSVKDDSE